MNMNFKVFAIGLFALLMAATSAEAANRYVRAGAGGNASGADWANAHPQLPASLVRGDTYYIADGTYGAYTFDDQLSGSTMITIKKATTADHGTPTGWQDSFGDGEALFTSSGTVWTFGGGAGYYHITGQVGTGNVAGSYGIRLATTASRNSAVALVMTDLSSTYSQTGNNRQITLDSIDFDWNNGTSAGSSGAARAVQWNASIPSSDIRLSNCYIHHSSGFGVYAGSVGSNLTVENCFFDRNGGSTNYHHETLWVTGVNGFTFRNNTIKDTVSGALTGWLMLGAVSNANIYNNVFVCSSPQACSTGGNGIIATWDANQYANANVNIANNTFANLPGGGNPAIYFYHSGGAVDTNVSVVNNLFITSIFGVVGATTQSNNSCGAGATCSGSNTQSGLQTTIFRNWSTQDLRLAVATQPGTNTSFSTDKSGTQRAADGVWDRGAFEFNSSTATTATPAVVAAPSGLTVR
jgi:hypothetical protein